MLLRDKRRRWVVLLSFLALGISFRVLVLPTIDAYTGGLVSARFTDDRLTGRDKIVQADLIIFRENPLLGVGPGQSKYGHEKTFRTASAHTEYSRLLAEHGSLGAVALVLLVAMGVTRLRRALHPLQRAVALSLGLWAALTMGHSAMRLAAPATMLALAGVRWVLPADVTPSPARRQPGRRGRGSKP
jgi:O-antigen ligase